MQKEAITALFDTQASSYDQQWSNMAPINDALHLLTRTVLSELPPTANILFPFTSRRSRHRPAD
jgi:tRNA (cmo5U34)-methyltransferase